MRLRLLYAGGGKMEIYRVTVKRGLVGRAVLLRIQKHVFIS